MVYHSNRKVSFSRFLFVLFWGSRNLVGLRTTPTVTYWTFSTLSFMPLLISKKRTSNGLFLGTYLWIKKKSDLEKNYYKLYFCVYVNAFGHVRATPVVWQSDDLVLFEAWSLFDFGQCELWSHLPACLPSFPCRSVWITDVWHRNWLFLHGFLSLYSVWVDFALSAISPAWVHIGTPQFCR